MNPLRIFLLVALILVVFGSGEADAGKQIKEPEWSYETEDTAWSVAISANGEYIAAGSADSNAYLFEKSNGTPLWSYEAENDVYQVAISADGEYIAAAGSDSKVYLFDKDSDTPLWSYTTGDYVRSVAISANGEYIAAGSRDDSGRSPNVYLFNKNSSTPLWNYTAGDWVESVAISADGEYIVAGSRDKKIYLFDKDSSTPLWNYTAEGYVLTVAVSADGEYIAAGSWDNNVYLFNKNSSTPLWSYDTEKSVDSVAISADGEYITAGLLNGIYLFNKNSSTPLWSYTIWSVESVAISTDGEYIAAGTGSSGVYLFNKNSSTPLWSRETEGTAKSVAISADGEYITTTASQENDDESEDSYNIYLFDNNIPPTATIDSITPSPVKFGTEVTFSGTGSDSDGTVVSYEWNSDRDGFLSDEEDFNKTNLSVGTHIISFRVQDSDADWAEDTVWLVVSPPIPDLAINGEDITYEPQNPDELENIIVNVTIHNYGDAEATEWRVKLYDGDPDNGGKKITEFNCDATEEDPREGCKALSKGENATVEVTWYGIQTTPGYHELYALAVDTSQPRQETRFDNNKNYTTILIIPNDDPVAIGTLEKYSVKTGEPIQIDAGASYDNETTNGLADNDDGIADLQYRYRWESKKNNDWTSWMFNYTYNNLTFSNSGEKWIQVQVRDLDDNELSEVLTLMVMVKDNVLPVAFIESIEPSSAEMGTTVFFNGTGSDSDGVIVAYLWESSFDGELSTEVSFSSSDLSLGHHTITFQIQDDDGGWGYTNSPLFIFAYPVAIAGENSTGTPGVPLQFSGAATDEDGTIAKYEWDFDGDGIFEWSSTENGRELNIYNNEGTYTATLRVTDNDGFTGTDTVEITISEKKVQIDDEGNVTVTDAGEDEEGIPSISLITSLISIGLIAIFRRK